MKKILLLLIALVFAGLAGQAQGYTLSVYGNVWNVNANALSPVPGHPVTITINDSINGGVFFYENTVFTDESGFYEEFITIPPSMAYGMVQTMTYDSCLGQNQYNYAQWGLGTVLPSLDFYLCGTIISGCENYFFYYNVDSATVLFEGYLMNGQAADSYEWDFGDGTFGSGQTVSHTYQPDPNGMGIYMVSLTTTVADSMGTTCTYTSWQEVWIGNPWPGDCFNYFYFEQSDSTTFTFTGEAYQSNGTISGETEYFWDFGDGTSGTGQTITHYFQANPAGFYTVCLETRTLMADGDTCIAFSCQDIWTVQPGFPIFGYVYVLNNMFADQAIVRLMTLDTLGQGVTEVANVVLDSSGFYMFPNVPMYNSRLYFVQAELTEGSVYYGDYIPTYHYNAMSWEYALPVMPFLNWTADVFLVPSSVLNYGSGMITGLVTELETRGYLEDVQVVLLDENMKPLRYTRSTPGGTFSFENLPMGTYVIHAEILGVHTNPATVTLTEGQPELGVEIQVTGDEANIVYGVKEKMINLEGVSEVYPNPVTSASRIDISMKKSAEVRISIYNQTGMLMGEVERNLPAGTQSLALSTGSLPGGLYVVRIMTADGDLVSRRMIKVQ